MNAKIFFQFLKEMIAILKNTNIFKFLGKGFFGRHVLYPQRTGRRLIFESQLEENTIRPGSNAALHISRVEC